MDARNSDSFAASRFAAFLPATLLLVVLAWAILLYPLGVMWALVATLIISIGLIKPELLIYVAVILGMCIGALKLQFVLGKSFASFVISLMPIPMFLALLFWMQARCSRLIPGLGYTTTVDLPILVTWLSAIISLLWTLHLQNGLIVVFQLTMGVMYYFVLTRLIRTREQIILFYQFWVILGIITLLGIIFSLFYGYDEKFLQFADYFGFKEIILSFFFRQYNGSREYFNGLVGSPKGIAHILNVAIPCVTIFLLLNKQKIYRVFFYILLVVMLGAHLLAASRAEMGGLFLGWIYVIYRTPDWHPNFVRYQVYLGLLLFLALGFSFLVVSQYSSSAMQDFLGRLGLGPGAYSMRGGSSAQGRMFRFESHIVALFENGGFGYGVGGQLPEVDPTLMVDFPNMPGAFLFDHGYGLLSLLLYCWIFLNVALEMGRALCYCQDQPYFYFLIGIAWILIAYGVASWLDHHFVMETYWIVLGFSMAGVQAAYLNFGGCKNQIESKP